MAFEYNIRYGTFIRPDYKYPDYDYDFDPSSYNFGVNYNDNVAAIWVGSDPFSYAYIELNGDTSLTAGHTAGQLTNFNINASNFNVNSPTSIFSGTLTATIKNFDIQHPSKEGWRLRYTCLEGPKNDVYIRGRVRNKFEIELPSYWKDFVDIPNLTVTLTPIGSHQEIAVKRIEATKIILQSKGNMPIDAFYTVYAERTDKERLVPEYEGSSPADYPGNINDYSL
jgi:hypothetical protein